MRPMAVCAIASTTIVVACSLGVVDLPPDPSPAELFVTSEIAPHPDDPSQVSVLVSATLDPGVARNGTPRRVTSDVLTVQWVDHSPTSSGDPARPTWLATQSYPAPGPEAVRLDLPRLEGWPAETVNMRVRVDVLPEGTIVLAAGDDLVLGAELPSNPAQELEWSLTLTSSSMAAYELRLGGHESWPEEVRVPAAQIPADALPLSAALRIQWDRSLSLLELTPAERYDLDLRSTMVVEWTVRGES